MTQLRTASRALAALLAAGALVLVGSTTVAATTTQSAGAHRVHVPSHDTGWNGT